MSALDTTHVDWCRNLFASLKDGGEWAVPRSGLIFHKQEEPPVLALTRTMPHMPEMPMSEQELLDYQREDLEAIREHFAAAGIEVVGEVSALWQVDGTQQLIDGRLRGETLQ